MGEVCLDDCGVRRLSKWRWGRDGGNGNALTLSCPRFEFAADCGLDNAEQIASRFAHLATAAARGPLVEHGLPHFGFHLLQRHQRAGLLFILQRKETLRQLQALKLACARYSTIYTITEYFSTVLLRMPKRAGFADMRACCGIRRRRFFIPKKDIAVFFGFEGSL